MVGAVRARAGPGVVPAVAATAEEAAAAAAATARCALGGGGGGGGDGGGDGGGGCGGGGGSRSTRTVYTPTDAPSFASTRTVSVSCSGRNLVSVTISLSPVAGSELISTMAFSRRDVI